MPEGNRIVVERTNLKTKQKTTYYIHQSMFFAACIYFSASLLFVFLDLKMSILCFLLGTFVGWRAIDVKED